MIVHAYVFSWNEHDLLPLFFKNYSWVDKIYFLDYNSDPADIEMMKSDPRVEIIQHTIKELDDLYILQTKNNIWKKSKEEADWVVVQDFDEFVYHPDMINTLKQFKIEGYTIVQCDGWEVSGDRVPTCLEGLRGVRNNRIDKTLIFNPKEIDINYGVGAHYARPTGNIKINTGTVKLLHLKTGCGIEYFLWRQSTTAQKLSDLNKKMWWGTNGFRPEDKQIAEFDDLKRKAVLIR